MKWKLEKLGTIVNNLDNKRIPLNEIQRREKESNSLYPYIGANNILSYIDEYIFDEKILCIAEDGGNWSKGQKCCFIVNQKCWVNNHAHVVSSKKSISLEFLCHYLNYSDLSKYIAGTTRGKLTRTALDSIPVPLPPLPTQQKIAEILDQADALRRKDKALLAKYDEMLQAVFYDMFGDHFLPGTKNRTEYLSAVGDLVSGVAKNTNTVKDNFVEVPYMRVANVQDGHINLNEIKSILVSQQDFNKYLLRENDLLLTEGGDPDKLGRGAVWKGQISPCIHQNHIFRIRITLPNLHPTYLSYLLSSRYGKAYFLKMAKQTTGIASINMTQLKNFQVIVPDFSLQKKFADVVESLEHQKSQIIQQQTHSESLFQSLMQQAFKGELVG